MRNVNLVTKCFIVDSSNKILTLKRANDALIRPGGWDLPGGMMDDNEDPNIAIIREISEETRLNAIIPKILFVATEYEPTYILTLFYQLKFKNDPLVLSSEHTEYKWLELTEFTALELPIKFNQAASHL